MAKQWKSLWDDSDDEGNGPDETKKSTGPRPNPNYRGNDDAAEDELASDEYGGYGWSGKFSGGYSGGSYRYDDTIDDSDEHWYRKNSFRYGKHADYSPSSLFRSAFSRVYSSGDDNEAKNKAIRALRNLTRSANTIVDKSTGVKNEFAVQFSAGADTNGTIAKLNDEKQRVVFVSPDELLAAKTTEEEDATVDALTGFVLLRVQMAQDVAVEVIDQINRTGSHLAGVKIAAQFAKIGGPSLATAKTETLHAMSSAAVDEYLAGMLAKSMLMRLSRRKVVLNWGGFAPYFIRHAKKFAAVKEHLEAAPLSVESVVGKLGYNMLADEEQIAVDKAFEDLADKHLGAEIPVPELLATCKKLVDDIREALTAHSEAAPGEMEAALNEMLDKAIAAQDDGKSDTSALEEYLEKFTKGMLDATESGDGIKEKDTAADPKMRDLTERLRSATSMGHMLKALSAEIDRAEKLLEETKSENPSVAESAKMALQHVRSNIKHMLRSRPQATQALRDAGFNDEINEISAATGDEKVAAEDIKALKEKTEQFLKKAEKFIKARREALKKETTESVGGIKERLEEINATSLKAHEDLLKLRDELVASKAADAETRNAAYALLNTMSEMIKRVTDRVTALQPEIAKADKTLASARSTATMETSHKLARNALSQVMNQLRHVSVHGAGGYGWYGVSGMIQDLMRELTSRYGYPSAKSRDEMVKEVIEAVVNKKSVSPAAYAAGMAAGAAGSAFDELEEMESSHDEDDDDEDEAEDEEEDDDDIDLGVDKATLQRMRELRASVRNAGLNIAAAESLGSAAAEKLRQIQDEASPVDGELFGDTVSAKTKILDSESIGRVNDEARNAPEEEYIAYLSHNSVKPKVGLGKEGSAVYRGSRIAVVKEVRSKHRGSIERVRNALQFQSGKRTAENFGLRSGDLDEGSLHKLGYDCDNIWSQKTISKLPDVAVGILVDQSGSMSGRKIENARTMCIILAEALKKIAGVRLYVYGHTANNGGHDLTIYEHYTPASTDLTALGGITSHSNNYDGYAIKDVAKRLALDSAKRKYLFVIADGLPSGHGYGGETAEKHVTSVCKFVRDRLKMGLNAFAVGVAEYQQPAFKRQYGDDHVVFINDIMKCLPQIVRFLRNTLQKERKLVGVDD